MLDDAQSCDGIKTTMIHRKRAMTLKVTLDFFRYLRDAEKRDQSPPEDDDLTAIPTKDLERIVKVGTQILQSKGA